MSIGTIKWFNDVKGYGFIQTEDGKDVFVHYSVINMEGYKSLSQGQRVQYEATEGPRGLQARTVQLIDVEDAPQ